MEDDLRKSAFGIDERLGKTESSIKKLSKKINDLSSEVQNEPLCISKPRHDLGLWLAISKQWKNNLNVLASSYHSHSVIFLCIFIHPDII